MPKTLLLLRDKLSVNNLDDLKAALEAEKLRELPGLGAKSEEKIAHAIERLGLHGKDADTLSGFAYFWALVLHCIWRER